MIKTKDGLLTVILLQGQPILNMKRGLYTTDPETVRNRIKKYDLDNIYKERCLIY